MLTKSTCSNLVSWKALPFYAVVAIAALLALLIATSLGDGASAAPVEVSVTRVWETRELEPEWRWQRPGAEYEHMYYSRGASDSNDWNRTRDFRR